MKKLFLAIYFISCFFLVFKAEAAVSNLEEAAAAASEVKPLAPLTPEGLPDPNNIDEVRAFFKRRFQTAATSDISDLGDLNKSNSMDIQHSAEYIQKMQEEKKSAFEKIYEQMLARLNNQQVEFSPDTVFYEELKQQPQQTQEKIDVPVVRVQLSNGNTILAPAREHIPYLLSSYHILPTGSIEVEDEVVVIANGQKLKNGLVKTMPKYTNSRGNVKKKIEVQILSVSLNGKEIPYKLQEIGNDIVFTPKEKYVLEPGVYTYRYKYLMDRKLWYYDQFTEFYTNLVGGYSDLVISSANAIVSVPDGRTFMSQIAMVGRPDDLEARRTVIVHLSKNALGFASLIPLAHNEGMHILVSLDKAIFNQPSIGRRFVWLIGDYGDILFSLLGLSVIFISYFLSWKFIRENKSRLIIRFKQTAPLSRYIFKGVYDHRSFVSALLDLVRYKIIDIKKDGNTPVLIKKTDSLKGLPVGLKTIMKTLFNKTDTSLEINNKNKLKFERTITKHENFVKKYFRLLTWRLNMWYLMFSLSMLFLTLLAISYIAVNPLETMMILVSASLTLAFYLWIFRHQFAKKWVNILTKITAGFFVALTVLLLSVYIRFISALVITGIIYVILEYSSKFSAKNGLIKNKAKELDNLYKYLKTNASIISKAKEFDVQQANIFAFDLEDKYESNPKNQKVYRLDVATDILKKL